MPLRTMPLAGKGESFGPGSGFPSCVSVKAGASPSAALLRPIRTVSSEFSGTVMVAGPVFCALVRKIGALPV